MLGALWPPICCTVAISIAGYTAWRSYQWANKSKAEGALLEAALAELGQLRSNLAAGHHLTPTELDDTLGQYLSEEIRQLLARTGVSIQPIIKALEIGVRNRRQLLGHLWTQMAGVRATTILLTQLPLFGIILGYILGAHPIHFLTHGYGTVLLLTGICCQCGGVWWIGRMLAALPSPVAEETLQLQLLSALLRTGIPLTAAHHILSPHIATAYHDLLDQAQRQGAPVADLLAELAADRATSQATTVDQHLEELGVLMARPLGLCFLPGFLLLGMLPAVIELGGSLMNLS